MAKTLSSLSFFPFLSLPHLHRLPDMAIGGRFHYNSAGTSYTTMYSRKPLPRRRRRSWVGNTWLTGRCRFSGCLWASVLVGFPPW
ncbi:uncharacterized protein YALI1_B12384g [Yarrowia lipolytica]|uniref:Uncharacterized protein n=1 Tax=Yarrowia lipolytica TaxID=4952 RepID=A0A1D8N727_YARLL|nr:hypothetical protein YALI1_B12384g [Yarrowia lipolytica]